MKRLLLALLGCLGLQAQFGPATTPYTRDFLRSTNSAQARDKLEIISAAGGGSEIRIVNTAADIAGVVRTNNLPLYVMTRGFASVGDRGGAIYQWVDTTVATNIYRIASQDGRRWVELDYLQKWECNVLKAGATPFDTTDDTTAIQRAFDAAAQQSTGGGVGPLGDEPIVYFPVGKYYINGTVSYSAPARNRANVRIRGDGSKNSTIIRGVTGFTPVLHIVNSRLSISGLRFYHVAGSPTPVPDYDFGTAIHLYDCDYGLIDDLHINRFSRGLVIDNDSMNWNTYRGLQFEGCFIDIFATGAQGSTIEAHSTGSAFHWFGPASGVMLYGHYEGSGKNDEFMPTGIYVPAGSDNSFLLHYNESSGWLAMLGVPLTNRVRLSVTGGNNVTAVFTNAHYYVTGHQTRIIAEQTVPSDIATGIVGVRTITGGYRTNNFVTFTAGNQITSDLSNYTFLMVLDDPSHRVTSTRVWGRGQGAGYRNLVHTWLDKVDGVTVDGSMARSSRLTARSKSVVLGNEFTYGDNDFNFNKRLPGSDQLAVNIFPDSHFHSGTNWIGPGVISVANGNVVSTNINGIDGLLFYLTAKPTSSYAQYYADWSPLVPMSSLAGKRLAVVAEIWELNHPSYRPTGFTVNAGGSGYVNGTATVTHGGRNIEVTLTTSGGAISSAVWRWNTFITNTGIANLAVVQGSASGGVITPTGYTDSSAWARTRNTPFRDYFLSLLYRGEGAPGTLGYPVTPVAPYLDVRDNQLKTMSMSVLSSPVDGTKAGLRVMFTDTSLSPENAVGTEAIFVPLLAILVEPDHSRAHEYFARRGYITPYTTFQRFVNIPQGPIWPGPAETDVAKLFARTLAGNTGLRLLSSGGQSGWLLHLLPDSTGVPAGAAPGALYRSNLVWRLFNGTNWVTTGGEGTQGGAGTQVISATLNGQGAPILANLNWGLRVNQASTITGWTVFADTVGSISIDVWKGTYEQYPLTSAQSITGGNHPFISNSNKNQGGVTGWTTTSINAGDFIWFNSVANATNITQATVVLHIQ